MSLVSGGRSVTFPVISSGGNFVRARLATLGCPRCIRPVETTPGSRPPPLLHVLHRNAVAGRLVLGNGVI